MYEWLKAFHVAAVIFWMAGLLYLPRLFVYHSQAILGGELETKMVEAEAKLLRIIMNPAMIAALLLGLYLLLAYPQSTSIHIKVALAFGLVAYHGFLAKTRKAFLDGGRPRSETFFRMINEIPALTAIAIVVLAIVEPV